MDVLLSRDDIYNLPSKQRVDAIVHAGTADLYLQRGPTVDRTLKSHYGDALESNLEQQRDLLEEVNMPDNGVVRITPGKLRCDFLMWVALRAPVEEEVMDTAVQVERLRQGVDALLRFAAERQATRVAIPQWLGQVKFAEDAEHAEHVVRAILTYEEQCYADKRSTGVEEVLVCNLSYALQRRLQQKLGRLVKEMQSDEQRNASRSTTASSSRKSRPRQSAAKKRLSPADIQEGLQRAKEYRIHATFAKDDWINHPRFGLGRVIEVHPEGMMFTALFEDASQRRLVHGR